MPVTPNDWNAVVVGAWNPAILTPQGIARRVFGLAQGTPVEVQVAIDQPSFVRVVHGGLAVLPAAGMLIVQAIEPRIDSLRDAAGAAARAIQELPETPYVAAGINIRYSVEPASELLQQVLDSTIDERLADVDLIVQVRNIKRTVAWRQGVLNIEIKELAPSAKIELNFHKDSQAAQELREWLAGVDDMVEAAGRVTSEVLGIRLEGLQ